MSELQPSRGRGRPARDAAVLSRDKVLAEALALLDEEGLAGLSVRALARRLGVAPMSLYNHVAGKEELLDQVHEAILGEIVPPPDVPELTWRTALREMAAGLRSALRAHPAALLLFATRPLRSPRLLAAGDRMLGLLLTAGFRPDQAVYAFDGVAMFTIGHAFAEFGPSDVAGVAAPELDGSDLLAQVGAVRDAGLHNLARVVTEAAPHDYEAEFRQGLDALLDGYEALLGRRTKTPQPK